MRGESKSMLQAAKYGNDGETTDGLLELFRNNVVPMAVREFLGFSTNSRHDVGEVPGSICWLGHVNA